MHGIRAYKCNAEYLKRPSSNKGFTKSSTRIKLGFLWLLLNCVLPQTLVITHILWYFSLDLHIKIDIFLLKAEENDIKTYLDCIITLHVTNNTMTMNFLIFSHNMLWWVSMRFDVPEVLKCHRLMTFGFIPAPTNLTQNPQWPYWHVSKFYKNLIINHSFGSGVLEQACIQKMQDSGIQAADPCRRCE